MAFAKAIRSWKPDDSVPNVVKYWLFAGVVMVFLQIVIGGVTRLTGSGLSITRWEIVTGTIPPLTSEQWEDAFNLYKQTPQYTKVNKGISMSDFKFIYFWEYFHRLWARLMFFVFVIPFTFFYIRRWFSKRLIPRLLIVVLLAALEGFFGWIMVASGLSKRPWVNAYNLTLHLTMGIIIFSYLLWTFFLAAKPIDQKESKHPILTFSWVYLVLLFFQIAMGALMSGTKAALFYPSWPDMNGAFIPAVLLDPAQWIVERFVQYDSNPFFPALIQFVHRSSAYLIAVLSVIYAFWMSKLPLLWLSMRNLMWLLLGVVLTQMMLGVLTLIYSIAVIPVLLGVLHQAVAIVLLSVSLWIAYVLPAYTLSSKIP